MNLGRLGELAFLACVVIAVLAGIFVPEASAGLILALLVVLGVIVGLLNVSEKETTPFLVAAIALIMAGTASFASINQVVSGIGTIIDSIVDYIAVFVAPAAIIVALKAVYSLASKK